VKRDARPVVLAAPSGAGKTTIARDLVRGSPDFVFSVSATTRAPRQGERPGVDYEFVTDEEFRAMVARGEFVEWAEVHGRLYGTPRRKVEESAGSGKHVVLDIDVQGARQIREALPEALHVFVLPPSADALVSRLTGRGTEALKDLVRRLKNARAEFQAATEFDVAVVNEHVDETVARIRQLVRGERPLVSDVPDLEDAVRKLRADIDAVLRDELGVDPTAADDG